MSCMPLTVSRALYDSLVAMDNLKVETLSTVVYRYECELYLREVLESN